ncbi:UNVERIFIED_CONTAM: hypothetical protein Sradi_5069300 [Sesamum radiatum]|uniref:RNase H type-1 domain-containing protein n=1 Tax=Sesamum radiatum TaxID=300843 RepID=A0AAW2M3B2_SESRA
MLAKQLWRIHCFPDRLLSQVLKARYFPHGNIFEASLSQRPSYTWRSLMAAEDIFRAGCRWRVGSGTSIGIWKDPWLPRPLTFGPITPPLGHMSEMKVSDLIDPQTQDWNAQLIRSIFWPVDSDLILGIPLGHLGLEDQIRVSLAPFVRRLEKISYIPYFYAHLRDRNCKLMQKQFLLPHQVIEFTENYLKSFKSQNSVTNIRLSSLNPQHWLCPPSATVKINCDGAVFEQGMEMGLGAIARDDQGRCLWWSSKRITRGGNGEIAEAMAVRHGLELGARLGWSSIILESDCANLISKIMSPDHDMSFIGPIVADSRSLAASFSFVHLIWFLDIVILWPMY